jgi:hypothetical protein
MAQDPSVKISDATAYIAQIHALIEKWQQIIKKLHYQGTAVTNPEVWSANKANMMQDQIEHHIADLLKTIPPIVSYIQFADKTVKDMQTADET